jgi:hypothetical protein
LLRAKQEEKEIGRAATAATFYLLLAADRRQSAAKVYSFHFPYFFIRHLFQSKIFIILSLL